MFMKVGIDGREEGRGRGGDRREWLLMKVGMGRENRKRRKEWLFPVGEGLG